MLVVREKGPVEFWNQRRRASSLPHASCAQGRRETLDDFAKSYSVARVTISRLEIRNRLAV